MLQLPRAAVTIDLASGVDCNICNLFFSQTNFDHLMLTFPNVFARGIKTNNQSLHTCEKQAYISNRFCSRVTETKSVTIAPVSPTYFRGRTCNPNVNPRTGGGGLSQPRTGGGLISAPPPGDLESFATHREAVNGVR